MSTGPFTHWRFRSARPSVEPGSRIRVYLTRFDPATGEGEARIGDTILTVSGASATELDAFIDLEVTEFDAHLCRGRARVV